MLLHRVLTAIPLAAVVIWLVIYQPSDIVAYVLLVITALAGFEWAHLAGIRIIPLRIVYVLPVVAVTWLFIFGIDHYIFLLISIATVWWITLGFYLFRIRPVEKGIVLSPLKLTIGLFLIPVAMLSIYQTHSIYQGPYWLLFALMLVWVADIGAYFIGRKFGKTKLAQHISPGKTVEGLIGAIVATVVFSAITGVLFELSASSIAILAGLVVIVTLISVVGDLYISVLKRESGLKDSGKILPGHGGILDRIDSVLAAMPVFYTGYYWLLRPLTEQ